MNKKELAEKLKNEHLDYLNEYRSVHYTDHNLRIKLTADMLTKVMAAFCMLLEDRLE